MASELPHKPPVNRLTDTAFCTSWVFTKRVGAGRQSRRIQTTPAIHGHLDLINPAVIRHSHLRLTVMLLATLGDWTDWAQVARPCAHQQLMLVNADSYGMTGVCCRRPLPFAWRTGKRRRVSGRRRREINARVLISWTIVDCQVPDYSVGLQASMDYNAPCHLDKPLAFVLRRPCIWHAGHGRGEATDRLIASTEQQVTIIPLTISPIVGQSVVSNHRSDIWRDVIW